MNNGRLLLKNQLAPNVKNRMQGIKPEGIDMELRDSIEGIFNEEMATRITTKTIKW
jgi:hypothetical protein